MKTQLRRWSGLVAGIAVAGIISGCGSGGGATGTAPNAQTRGKAQNMHRMGMQALGMSGAPAFGMASAVNGGGMMGGGGAQMPFLGSFAQKIAANPPLMRASNVKRSRMAMRGRGEDDPSGGGGTTPPGFQETFYYDFWMGLWVQIVDSSTSSGYYFFEDEAKTKPAGQMLSTWPADMTIFPQVWASTYEITAGAMKGWKGSYTTTTNADTSGKSDYTNEMPGGWKSNGKSTWTAAGDYTWTSRYEDGTGYWMNSTGSSRSNGTGGHRMESSDGYGTDTVYNADGSGRTKFTGPDPGLPATMTWDAQGNVTIVWADGTVERYPSYWFGPYPAQGGGGGSTEGGAGGGTVQSNAKRK